MNNKYFSLILAITEILIATFGIGMSIFSIIVGGLFEIWIIALIILMIFMVIHGMYGIKQYKLWKKYEKELDRPVNREEYIEMTMKKIEEKFKKEGRKNE